MVKYLLVLMLLTFPQEKKKHQLKVENGFYGDKAFGHAFWFYEFRNKKAYRYSSNVGSRYGQGTYQLNLADSTIIIRYSMTYYSKYPWKDYLPLKNDTLKACADENGFLRLQGYKYAKSTEFFESQKKRIKKGSKIIVK